MKKKLPKTKLEIELTCDKMLLAQQVKKLQAHLQAALNTLDVVLNEKGENNITKG
ncbi:MAG TPA: hypothetical protein VKG26_06495 [Bacteroidia bacterium]|nr:hypothetical protein [Bacteroidia bacterium]